MRIGLSMVFIIVANKLGLLGGDAYLLLIMFVCNHSIIGSLGSITFLSRLSYSLSQFCQVGVCKRMNQNNNF